MALQLVLDRTNETGDSYPVAYWRVDGLVWSRIDASVGVTIGVYRDQAAAAAKQPVLSRGFTATGATANQIMTANDVRNAVYVWLKTLPAFSGAADA